MPPCVLDGCAAYTHCVGLQNGRAVVCMQYAGSNWLVLASKHVHIERRKSEIGKRARVARYIEILEAKVAALEQVRFSQSGAS